MPNYYNKWTCNILSIFIKHHTHIIFIYHLYNSKNQIH